MISAAHKAKVIRFPVQFYRSDFCGKFMWQIPFDCAIRFMAIESFCYGGCGDLIITNSIVFFLYFQSHINCNATKEKKECGIVNLKRNEKMSIMGEMNFCPRCGGRVSMCGRGAGKELCQERVDKATATEADAQRSICGFGKKSNTAETMRFGCGFVV